MAMDEEKERNVNEEEEMSVKKCEKREILFFFMIIIMCWAQCIGKHCSFLREHKILGKLL
jgi:hypothetical protein